MKSQTQPGMLIVKKTNLLFFCDESIILLDKLELDGVQYA